MIRNNLSWINLNAGSSGGSGGGGVSDYNDLANRPIISMTGTSQNPLKLWNLSTGLYLLNGYVYYNTTNTRECVNLFVSITAQIQNGKYVLSAFVPSWEGHYEYIKANSTSTDYKDTQILKMLTEDDVLTLTNEVEYTPTTDYHPSTKKYVDEAMQSVMEEFAKMGVNEQDIKTLIAENRRRDIAIQALLNETADKNVTIEEDTHTISLDYSMEDGMATVNSIEGSTLVNVSKTVDEVYVTKSQDRVEQTKVANTIGEQNGKICPIIEGDTLVNVCDQKDPIAITKSYTVENSGNHIALQGEYDGKCRPVIQGNTMVNLANGNYWSAGNAVVEKNVTDNGYSITVTYPGSRVISKGCSALKDNTTYTLIFDVNSDFGELLYSYYDGQSFTQGVTSTIDTNDYSNGYTRVIVTRTTTTNCTDIVIGNHGTTSAGKYLNVKNVMLFEGDLTQTPELIPTEYVEGLKNSFEDNLITQAMVDNGEESAENLGKYKVEYKVTGKNKFDGVFKVGTIQSDGSYDDSWIGYMVTDYIKLKRNSQYHSKILYNNTQLDMFIKPFYYDVNFNYLGTDTETIRNPIIKTLDIPFTYCILRYYIRDGGYDKTLLSNIQVEEGSTATEYEPYKEYTKTFYLNSPLLEGDTIEDMNGVATHVKRYNRVVLNNAPISTYITNAHANHIVFAVPHNSGHGLQNSITIKLDRFLTTAACFSYDVEGAYSHGNNIIISIAKSKLSTLDINGFNQWLQANPVTAVYQLKTPIYEPISDESILCDSYVNGHLDFDSAVPIEKVKFNTWNTELKYLKPSTDYKIKFVADNYGKVDWFNMATATLVPLDVVKGTNEVTITTSTTIADTMFGIYGIGFNASNIVVTEATDKDFDYFNGIQSTFEENLVTDENNPHYGKYRVIYRTKSSDGNASTVKSVYLNSPLLQGDKLVVVNGKLCHYHKMGKVVLDGSEDEKLYDHNISENHISYYTNILDDAHNYAKISNNFKVLPWSENNRDVILNNECLWVNGSTSIGIVLLKSKLSTLDINGFKQWLQANPTTVVYELASPYYEEISSNPKDTVVDFYANGTLEVQSAVYPLSMEFTSFEEELTYLYASTVYTVQFEANGNAIANITLGGTTVTNQEIIHGLNKIQVTTPSTLIDNKLIIDGSGDCKISKIVVTNSIEEFEYFEGMKSAFEDKQNEDGTYTVEIVVYNAPIRLNKDKE